MSFYSKHILPRLLNSAMRSVSADERASVVKDVHGTVVEIGFGSGYNIPFYTNVTKLIAVDPSNELFALAKDRVAAAPFPVEHLSASAESIPLPDASADAVVSTWSLCSIPHPELALAEVARILKPNGVFYFIEHGKAPKQPSRFFQTILTPFTKRLAGGCHLDRDIPHQIESADLTITTLKTYPQPGRPLAYTYAGTAKRPL